MTTNAEVQSHSDRGGREASGVDGSFLEEKLELEFRYKFSDSI